MTTFSACHQNTTLRMNPVPTMRHHIPLDLIRGVEENLFSYPWIISPNEFTS